MPLLPQAIISGFHERFLAQCVTVFRVFLTTPFLLCTLGKPCQLQTKKLVVKGVSVLTSSSWSRSRCTLSHEYTNVDLTGGFIAGCLKTGRCEIYIDLYINIVGYTYILRAGRRYTAGELFPLLQSLLWKHFHRPNNTEWRVCISHNATALPHTHKTHKHTCRPANLRSHTDINMDI